MGDIQQRWLDPKTVELYNTDRGGGGSVAPSPPDPLLQQMYQQQMSGSQTTQAEMDAIQNSQYAQDESTYYPQPTRADKIQWKREIKKFDRYMKKDGTHVEDGIDSLLQSGALWAEPSGNWSTSVPITQGQMRTLGDALKAWGDQVNTGDPYYLDSWNKSREKYKGLYDNVFTPQDGR